MASIQKDEIFLFRPQGRLDQQGGLTLKHQISSIEPERHNLWIIDMAQVDFMDSAGLLALVNALHTAERNQCRLVICNLLPAVRLILEITQLDQVLEISDSHAEVSEMLKPSLPLPLKQGLAAA